MITNITDRERLLRNECERLQKEVQGWRESSEEMRVLSWHIAAERDALLAEKQSLLDQCESWRATASKFEAERDALQAKLAALEGAYIPTYLERLAASPATLEAEFTALRSEALDLRAALAERDAIAKDNDKAHALLRQSLDALEAAHGIGVKP